MSDKKEIKRKNYLKFIVDTGAAISIIPKQLTKNLLIEPTPVTLSSASGQKLTVHGQTSQTIEIPSLNRSFRWTFIVADIVNPLLGLDFLNNFQLLIDCANNKIIDSQTNRKMHANVATCQQTMLIVNEKSELPSEVQELIKKYESITSPNYKNDTTNKKVYHRINTGSNPPVFAMPRKLSEFKQKIARRDFNRMLEEGIIVRSDSDWSSALHMVDKASGDPRSCGDYRSLNSITVPDRYPIPNINTVTNKLHDKSVFSEIDLLHAYFQIPVHPDDVKKLQLQHLLDFTNSRKCHSV